MASDLMVLVDDLMLQERWDDAIAFLQSRMDEVQADYRLSWTLGWAYVRRGDSQAALPHLLQAEQLEPADSAVQLALGTVHLNLGHLSEAEECLRKSIHLRETVLGRMTLAMVYIEQKRLDAAEQVHLDGIVLDGNSAERWEAYADFLSDAGRKRDAEKAYRRAKELTATSS